MNNHTRSNGFTLIELMIVVAILAIVTTIAVPAYTGYVETAKTTEAWNNLNSLQLALEEYYIENGNYSATMTDDYTSTDLNWAAKPDAGGTHNFKYSLTGTATSYTISATRKSDNKVFSLSGP